MVDVVQLGDIKSWIYETPKSQKVEKLGFTVVNYGLRSFN